MVNATLPATKFTKKRLKIRPPVALHTGAH
jgi:hypothetical protein